MSDVTRIYLDHNATSPVLPEVIETMGRVLAECFGNPSSVHWAGADARAAVEQARGQVAALLGVDPDEVVFTSSATESNNIVLRSAASAGGVIVTCATEHPSVLETLRDLEGVAIVLPVERDGRVEPARLERALADHPEAGLVSVMWANNETGVVQPIAELAAVAARRGVAFHSDAVQALGKLPLALGALPVDFASFSAHKLGGPKGSGALYVRRGAEFAPLLRGGGQERGRRAGTENVPGIAGFGAACAAAGRDLEARGRRLRELADRLWHGIEAKVPDVHCNSALDAGLPHTLNVSFGGADAEALVMALDLEGIAVASGAACHSGSTEPSHVLLAMGVPPALGASAVRFSLGPTTSAAEIEAVLEVLPAAVERVRKARRSA